MSLKKASFLVVVFSSLFTGTGVWAQAVSEVAAQPPKENIMQTLSMFGIIILAFYFVLWRPEKRKQKALVEQRKALKVGDRVVAMGIVGTISSIKDESVIIKMYDGAKIEMLKAGISDVQSAKQVEEATAQV